VAVDLPQLQSIEAIIRRDAPEIEIIGPWGAGKTLIALQTANALKRPMLIVAPTRIEAEAIHEDLVTFAGEEHCAMFPAWEVLPGDAMAPSDDIVAERMNTLTRLNAALIENTTLHTVAPVRALLQAVIPPKRLTNDTLALRVGEEHPIEDLLDSLIAVGYERELMVERWGQMSVRGGVFDVFPISANLPYRLEFFGDEIESIRRFEPETQRSVSHVDTVIIPPRSEKATLTSSAGSDTATLLDYISENTLVTQDEPMAVAEEGAKLEAQFGDSPFLVPWAQAEARLRQFKRITVAQIAYAGNENAPRVTVPMGSMTTWQGHAEDFWGQLETWNADGFRVVILCNTTGERQRLHELLEEHGYRPGEGDLDLHIGIGQLRAGFSSQEDRLAVLSERDMFGRHYVRRKRRRFEAGVTLTSFDDLKVGDLVVHIQHGIGRYLGLKRFQGKAGDFIAIQYMSGDKLYVPVTHIDSIQKYSAGGESGAPRIDKLGGATWARKKARVKKAVRDMTEDLLKLYAEREGRQGHAFGQDTHWQNEFEDAFEYEETPDQARAITDAKRDMQSGKPMDRLVCGDVGFGKTEVALRAAFKAVMDGAQVALLAPTTVLAEQHYATFSERLADYPVAVEVLNRFRSPKEVRTTVERLKSGEVDIAIGTHRILSKDVQFKNLGLVIIDEEQRFGVAQKERLKSLRTTVDVLTLSATPIPRTLNMSLLGVRDMSVINTAPNDRLPVHTCIEAFDEGLIKEAITRELARQGQVFFVHNRIQTIIPFATLVSKLAPGARVAIGHGQMPDGELDRVMAAFIRKEIDVLVCTTIIGSGLDIPNANTIIITDADRFGLADLYQLRGRVGRYKHRAFAYLLVPGDRVLSEDATKRLKALEEFSILGAGFRLALRDLEIRGCGNLLGGEQHGNIAAVGYDAYTQLIQDAVAELKGEPVHRRVLPPFEIAIDAYIPEEYVPSESQKITLYKRISSAKTADEVAEMSDELVDRFGPPPAPVRRLLEVMRVRGHAADLGVTRIVAAKKAVAVEFESGQFLSRKNRNTLTHEFGQRLTFSWKTAPTATLTLQAQSPEETIAATDHLLTAFGEL
jgi:transcription-repair coupling factor (superfamily II helicase)